MQIYYVNDENEPVIIRINGQMRISDEFPMGDFQSECVTLAPREARVFTIDAPENTIAYVKRWETRVVLLSYIDPAALEQLLSTEST